MVTGTKLNPEELNKIHLDVLPEKTRGAFLLCASLPFFSQGGWYLAGGTALALHAGHRQSVDLDFFTAETEFDQKKIEETLAATGEWKTTSLDKGTVYGELKGAKISLIAYPYFKIAGQFTKIGHVAIAQPADIAAMKITAISQRGKRRDFIDLYWISKNIQPLLKSIESVAIQYSVPQNQSHILKSLVYFDDAEGDPMPTLLFKATWQDIKKYFQSEVPRIAKQIMGLE